MIPVHYLFLFYLCSLLCIDTLCQTRTNLWKREDENLKDNDKNKPKKGRRNIISVCVILIIYRKNNKDKDRERCILGQIQRDELKKRKKNRWIDKQINEKEGTDKRKKESTFRYRYRYRDGPNIKFAGYPAIYGLTIIKDREICIMGEIQRDELKEGRKIDGLTNR